MSSRLNNESAELALNTTGSPNKYVDPYKVEKVKEEIFEQRNLEYEQRLKEHHYQFEIKHQKRQQRDNEIDGSLISDRESNANFQQNRQGSAAGSASRASKRK